MVTLMAILTKVLNFIKLHWRAILMTLGVFFLLNSARGCYHKIVPQKPISGPSSPTTPILPKGDTEQIVVKNNEVQVTTQKGTTVTNGNRGVTIDVKKDGSIVVTPKTHGFVLNPMLGAAVNNTGVKGVLGTELYFYKKLDLLGGIGVDKYLSHTSLFLALGYTPESKWIHNTSIWIGPSIDTTGTKSLIVGVSVRI